MAAPDGGKAHPARRLARKLGRSGIGRTISAAAHGVGLVDLSRRVSRHSNYVPAQIAFTVRDRVGTQRQGYISSGGGADHVAKMVWLSGLAAYEKPLPDVYAAAVRLSEGAVFEIGANSGLYVVIASLLTQQPQRIHAFEPFPPAMDSLQANLRLNGLEGRPNLAAKAAGAAAGEATLYIPSKKHGEVLETSASLRSDFKSEHSGNITVPVITVDDYVAQHGIDRIGVIKADVEGFEASVLKGAMQTLKSLRPLLFVEVLSWKTEAPALEIIRKDIDYRAVWLAEDRLIERDAVEVCPHSDNQLLYPREHRDLFLRVAEDAKIPVSRD